MEEKTTELKTANEQEPKEENNHSIYNYLKGNPTVLLAFISAIVAFVTFFAKFATLIYSQKELEFWEFDSSYATFGDESIIYTVIFAVIFSCFIIISSMLLSFTYEVYFQHKKDYLLVKFYLNKEKDRLKSITKKAKNDKIKKQKTDLEEKIEQIKQEMDKSKKSTLKDLFFNILFTLSIVFLNSILIAISIVSYVDIDTWLVVLIFFLTQIFTAKLLKFITKKTIIKKKELKKECDKFEINANFFEEQEYKEYPFNKLFRNGICSVLSNSNIILILVMIILNSIALCCFFAFEKIDPTENSKIFQITEIDNTPYVIIYQDGEKYYLEEFDEIKETEGKESKESIIVYTNMQRIITPEDITIKVKKYDYIDKEHKEEKQKENNE